MITCAYFTPSILAFFIPTGFFFYGICLYYTKTKQQLQRLESVNKSPIFSQFNETVNGATSIRAYRQTDRFIRENREKINVHMRCGFVSFITIRWLGTKVEIIGCVITFMISLFCAYFRFELTPGFVGLLVANGQMLIDNYGWAIRMICELEGDSVALERLSEYQDLTREDEWFKGSVHIYRIIKNIQRYLGQRK